jgi:hypothetical protein
MVELCMEKKHCSMSTRALKSFTREIQDRAMEYIPEEHREWFLSKLPDPKRCAGQGDQRCAFSLLEDGGPSCIERRRLACLFCSPGDLAERCGSDEGVAQIHNALRAMQPEARRTAILERVPYAARARFERLLPTADQDLIYAQWDTDLLKGALEILNAAISTRVEDRLPVELAELQALAEGIPAPVLRLANLEGMPAALRKMKDMPRRGEAMELLSSLHQVATAAADGQHRSASAVAAEATATAADPGKGRRRRRAKTEDEATAVGKRARRRSGQRSRFVLRAEDEEEDGEEEEDEAVVVYARWDRTHLNAALETLDAAVSTAADDRLTLTLAELQALTAGIPPSVLRLAGLDDVPETLRQMKNLPKRTKTMDLLGTLQRVAAAAAASAANNRLDGPASAAAPVPSEVPATIPDIEAVGRLIIRRLTTIDSNEHGAPTDLGFDAWEEDTISDVVERVFASLGLDGTPADFDFRRVVFVKEGDAMMENMIPVEGAFKAVEAKEVVLCRKKKTAADRRTL